MSALKRRPVGAKLSTKSCGLGKLSALKRRPKTGLSALKRRPMCAETPTPYIYLYPPVSNTPVVGAAPTGDKSATCRPFGLHLLPTAFLEKP